MATYFPPLLQTDRAEGYARPWTVKAELLSQHQQALHELQTDPNFIAHLQWMQHNIPEFAWIDPHNPATYSLKFLQEADGTIRINVKANPTDIGKHIPLERRFGLIHQYAAFLLGIGNYPVLAPASPTPLLSPQLSPRTVSRSPVPSTDEEEEEEERPRELSQEFAALQQMVRDQQQQIAQQGELVGRLTQFIQTQAVEQRDSQAAQLDALQRANADAIRDLKTAHAASMEQFQRMHDESREDLLAAMGDMQRQYQAQLDQLEHQRTDLAGKIDALRDEHREALQTFRQDRDAQFDRMQQQHTSTLRAFRQDHTAQIQQMTDQHAAQMQAQREQQAASEERFTQAITDLGERSDQRLADSQRHSEQLVQQVTQDAGRWRRTLLRQSREHRQDMAQQFAAYREDLNARFEELRELFESLHPAPSFEALSVPASPQHSRSPTPELEEPADDGQGLAASPPPEDDDHARPPQDRELVQEFSEENARLYRENLRLQNVALQFQVLSERVPQLQEQILHLEQIRTRYSEAERLVGQLAPMEQELRNLRTLIGQKDSDFRQLGDALRNLELRASEALRQAEHYRGQVQRLERHIAQLRDQAPDQTAQLLQLQTELHQEQQRREQAENLARRLQDLNQSLSATIDRLERNNTDLTASRDEARDQLHEAEAYFAEQRDQLEAQMAETRQDWLAQMRDLQTARDQALGSVQELEDEMNGHIAAREAAEADLHTTEAENQQLQRRLRQSQNLIALQEGHLERLEARTAQLTFMLLAGQSWLHRLHQPFPQHSVRHVSERPRPQIAMIAPRPQQDPVPEPEAEPQERSLGLDSSEPFDDYSRMFFSHIPRPLPREPRVPRPPFAPQTTPLFRNRFALPHSSFPIWALLNPQLPIGSSQSAPPRKVRSIYDVILTGDAIEDGVALYQFLDQERRESASAELEDGTSLQPLIRNPLFNFQRQQHPAVPVSFSGPGQFGVFSHLFRQPPPNPVPPRTPPRMPNSPFPSWTRQSQQAASQQPGFTGPSIDDYSRLLHHHLMNRRQPSQSASAPVQQTPPPRAFRFTPPLVTDISDLAPDLHAFAQRPAPSPQQQTPPATSPYSSEDFMFWSN